MSINVGCACGKQFRVKDEHAGRKGKCPACGEVVEIPRAAVNAIEASGDMDLATPAAKPRQTTCPACGGTISSFAMICEHCKTNLKQAAGLPAKKRASAAKQSRVGTAPGSPALGIALGLGAGLASAFACAWAYAYIDLFFPFWSILITLAFGGVMGFVPSVAMVAGGLRSRKIGFPIVAIIVAFGYWLTWAMWIHAVLSRKGNAPDVSYLLTHPSDMNTLIRLINEAGIWSYGGGEAVHGGTLTLVWIGEAIILLGAAITAAWSTLDDNLPG